MDVGSGIEGRALELMASEVDFGSGVEGRIRRHAFRVCGFHFLQSEKGRRRDS